MNLVQKFVESEAQKAAHGYRQRFETWLASVDIDNNGTKDREQILADFDRIRDGMIEVIGGLTDLQRLAHEYYTKYAHDQNDPPRTAKK
jgi:hypothetical protein